MRNIAIILVLLSAIINFVVAYMTKSGWNVIAGCFMAISAMFLVTYKPSKKV